MKLMYVFAIKLSKFAFDIFITAKAIPNSRPKTIEITASSIVVTRPCINNGQYSVINE